MTLYKEQWLKLLDMSADIRAFIAANKAQQTLIQHEPDGRDRRHRAEAAQHKAAGSGRDRKTDIAAEQIKRPMRQIDDTKQAEDQRKAACDHKKQGREGQPVEKLERAHPL